MKFGKVTIVGVGLIGGSLGMAIRKRGLAEQVIGVVRRQKSALSALKHGALDNATMSLRQGVAGADLVILSSPVSTIIEQMRTLRKFLKPEAIVIDVASSKLLIDHAAKRYLKGVRFVGCHPMAGAANTGVQHANPDLFEGAVCFMTDNDRAVQGFWRALGSSLHFLTPEKHDEWVARVSHLPHILAFALFQSGGAARLMRMHLEASNPSIQDLARLSKSDPKLWADILLSNKFEILKSLTEHEKSISTLKKALTAKNSKALEAFIHRANRTSRRLSPGK